jgi:transposase
MTLIGSLALRGVVTSMSVTGSVDALCFDSYVGAMLRPQLRRDDIVLLDNLPAHQASQVEAEVAKAKARVMWLPAYSPDFSPIENCWLKVKTLVRGKGPRTPKELNAAVAEALRAITEENIKSWFEHCGY